MQRTNERTNERTIERDRTNFKLPTLRTNCLSNSVNEIYRMQILIIPMKYQVFLIHVVRVGTNQTTAGSALPLVCCFRYRDDEQIDEGSVFMCNWRMY